jgi:hypothetical protein
MLVYFLTFLATYKNIKRLDTPDNILDTIAEIDINLYKDNNNNSC